MDGTGHLKCEDIQRVLFLNSCVHFLDWSFQDVFSSSIFPVDAFFGGVKMNVKKPRRKSEIDCCNPILKSSAVSSQSLRFHCPNCFAATVQKRPTHDRNQRVCAAKCYWAGGRAGGKLSLPLHAL
jgi:hypothetical protein